MPQTLSITSKKWSKDTGRFFARGRSDGLKDIDTALGLYETAKTQGWNSKAAQDALETLQAAINAWSQGRGIKSNGNIASCRDSKGLVTRLIGEIVAVLDDIRDSPAGRQRRAQNMHNVSVQQVVAKSKERIGGTNYVKSSSGGFQKKIFSQEQDNSCACACACTFASYLSGIALREDVFRKTYDQAKGSHHDFHTIGTTFPPIAEALQSLGIDAAHVPTTDWQSLQAALRKATTQAPILFGVSWGDGTQNLGSHAIICKGTTLIAQGGAQHPGFVIEDPWPDHKDPILHDDGSYWVYDTKTNAWSGGYANAEFGYVLGKPSRREIGRMTPGVKLPGM